MNTPERYLQYWRGHINLNDVYDQTTALEFDSVVSNWVSSQPPTPPGNTPWVRGVSPGANQWVKGVIPGGNG
jgi:hypothetical protein